MLYCENEKSTVINRRFFRRFAHLRKLASGEIIQGQPLTGLNPENSYTGQKQPVCPADRRNMEKLINRKDAAKYLGIGLSTLDLARAEGKISYIQYTKNGCVYFTEDGLQEYIARSTHRARMNTDKILGRRRR